MGYLSRCGPVDCISKVTNLQGTFYEGPRVALLLPFSPSPKIQLHQEIRDQNRSVTRTTTLEAQKGLACYSEDPEPPDNSEALTETEKRPPPLGRPFGLPTPDPYLAAFALFRSCCSHHLSWSRMFCEKKGEMVMQSPWEKTPTS